MKGFGNYFGLFLVMMVARIGVLVLINVILMALAWFYPRTVMLLYIMLPIISFFMPEKK